THDGTSQGKRVGGRAPGQIHSATLAVAAGSAHAGRFLLGRDRVAPSAAAAVSSVPRYCASAHSKRAAIGIQAAALAVATSARDAVAIHEDNAAGTELAAEAAGTAHGAVAAHGDSRQAHGAVAG